MNFLQFKTLVALNADNLKTSHPRYSLLGDYVNDGVRMFIMRASLKFPNLQIFPEHKDIEWDDVTVANQRYLPLPSDQFAIQRVFSADSASVAFADATWRPLSYISPKGIDQLPKSTTNVQYPTLYTQREGNIEFFPIPRTGKTTRIKIDGIGDEPIMTADLDVPRTHFRWHRAIACEASALLLNDMGMPDDAKRHLDEVDQILSTVGATILGMRRVQIHRKVHVRGIGARWGA